MLRWFRAEFSSPGARGRGGEGVGVGEGGGLTI